MPPLVIPSTVQVRLIWTRGGEDHAVNVLHFLNSPAQPVNVAMANNIAAAIATEANASFGGTTYATWVCTPYALDRLSVRDISTASLPEIFSTTTPIFVGTSAAQPLPPATSLVTTLRTALAGKSYRGRIYGLGYGETSNDALGDPLPAGAVRQNAFWQRSAAAIAVSTGLRLAVASRTLGGSKEVTSFDTNSVWDTQRRRNRRGI